MCVAIKADAYGHGAVECAKAAIECGTDYFAVAAISEGIQLREAGITCPILVLSLCSPDEMDDLVGGDPEHFPLHIWHTAEVPETTPDNQPKIG